MSIWDLQEQYEAIVKEVRTTLSATLNSNDVAIQRQAATSDGRVTGIRSEFGCGLEREKARVRDRERKCERHTHTRSLTFSLPS